MGVVIEVMTMEINVTRLLEERDRLDDFSASVAELGEAAGEITWDNSMEEAERNPFLDTPEKTHAWKTFLPEFGAWDEEEILGWNDQILNALFLQHVAGSMREILRVGEIGSPEYWEAIEAGRILGDVYPGDDGEVYYYIGI